MDIIERVWSTRIHGYLKYQILKKMQMLKRKLKAKFSNNHIENQFRKAERQLRNKKDQMDANPLNPLYTDLEKEAVNTLCKAKTDYASYISPKVKLNWLNYGDENTNLFYRSINKRRKGNTI